MPQLTAGELQQLNREDSAVTLRGRPIEQWAKIFKGLTPAEAAARVMGDLVHYQADRRKGMDNVRARWFLEDVAMLATALQGFATLKKEGAS